MKKWLFVILTLVIISCTALYSFAAPIKIECEDALELGGGSNIQDFATASGLQLIGLKPDDVEIETFARYEIDIAEDGIYTFTFTYAASDGDAVRKADISIDGERIPLNIHNTADWDTYDVVTVTFELFTGKHELILHSPADYDNATIKTPNVDFFVYEKTGDIIVVVAEQIEEPITASPVDNDQNVQPVVVTAPQTSDSPMILILIILTFGSCVIYSKKLKR